MVFYNPCQSLIESRFETHSQNITVCAVDKWESKNLRHSALMVNLIKLCMTRKKLLQHECLTPIESGITLSQIL